MSAKTFNERVDRHGNIQREELEGRQHKRAPFPQRGLKEWRVKPLALTSSPKVNDEIHMMTPHPRRDQNLQSKPLTPMSNINQTEEEIQRDLDEATLLYLSCPDPTEAAARRQRVMSSDAKGQRAETMVVMMRSTSNHLKQIPAGAQEIRTGYKQTKERIMEDLQDVTKQYLSCTDSTEAAARKQRVLADGTSGLMEETADSILAASANIRRPLSPWERGISPQGGEDKDDDNELDPYYSEVSPPQELPPKAREHQEQLISSEQEEILRDFQNKVQNSPSGGRGAGEVQRLREIHKRNFPDIYILMETKNNLETVKKKLQGLPLDNNHEVPPNSPGSGGLFLIWKNDIQLTVRTSNKNFIDTLITEKGITFQVTFVYGEPDHTKRLAVWNELSSLQPATGDPWFLTGKAIGNGLTTIVWKDSWISLDKDTKFYGPIQEDALDLTVSNLLTSDMQWNKSIIEQLLPQVAKEIQMLQPGHRAARDIYVWQPLQSGVYSTKSGYYTAAMKDQIQVRPSDDSFDWIKDIWAERSPPKMKLFMWSIAQEALPLGELLQRRGIQSGVACVRCN
ncbi:BnaC01g21840D [Brassica napus]|uniref:BnaC01g21840D protein n=1 Tax=Brassica napus TaxID=3708 RepID=A0A078HAE2_BRANA|nr:BnaC01g21840D [Brassica napus]